MAANAASVTTYQSTESDDEWFAPESTIVVKTANTPLVVPYGSRDAITNKLIYNGMKMVDFSNEREHNRYYTFNTFRSLDLPKRNPFDRTLIKEVLYYVATVARKSTGGRQTSRNRHSRRRLRYSRGGDQRRTRRQTQYL